MHGGRREYQRLRCPVVDRNANIRSARRLLLPLGEDTARGRVERVRFHASIVCLGRRWLCKLSACRWHHITDDHRAKNESLGHACHKLFDFARSHYSWAVKIERDCEPHSGRARAGRTATIRIIGLIGKVCQDSQQFCKESPTTKNAMLATKPSGQHGRAIFPRRPGYTADPFRGGCYGCSVAGGGTGGS